MGEARAIHKLTARKAAVLSKPGRHSDGGGLFLSIGQGGQRRWTFMWVRDGRQREAGLGSASIITLAEARQRAAECRQLVAKGEDPIAAKRAAKAAAASRKTFGQCAEEVIAAKRPEWRSARHTEQWERSLASCRGIWNRFVDEISVDDVRAVLIKPWDDTPETARRLRSRIELVLDYAIARKLRAAPNPAQWKGNLAHMLPRRPKLVRGHMAALPYSEIPSFLSDLRARPPSMATKALELLLFTVCRSGEVLNATWGEFDLDGAVWTVPAARTKAGREHRIPLSPPALDVLAWAANLRTSNFVFAGRLARKPLTGLIRFMPTGTTVHGLRSSFRDWAGNETSFPREPVELCLAHRIGDATEQAYRRSDALERRREILNAWAAYTCGGRADD